MGNDYSTELEEFQRVLEGTLAFLRAQAANELSYSAMMRMERRAYHRANALLVDLGVYDGGSEPQHTDELLSAAVSDVAAARQSVAQISPGSGLVDEGPEGVADEVNREVSEEIGLADADTGDAEVDVDDIDLDDEPTANPGTQTPMPAAPRFEEEDVLIDGFDDEDDAAISLDESALEAGEDVLAIDDIEELDAEEELEEIEFDDFEEQETGEVARTDRPPEPEERPKPLLPDFDFDDDSDEVDATVVFAIGGEAGADIAAMLEEEAGGASDPVELVQEDEAPDSFDLMPDVLAPEDEVEIEELEEVEPEPAPLDDGPAPLNVGATASVGVATGARVAASPRVAAGLYGNPNVPTIREEGRPSAAAVQISAGPGAAAGVSARGTGGPAFEEEEELLEIGGIEDYEDDYEEYEDDDDDGGGGFRLGVQEYEEEEEWEEEEEEEEPAPAPVPVPRGPSAAQIAAALKAAQRATEQGNMRAGIDLFSDVIDADPDSVEAHVGRGRLFLDLGDYTRAMSDFMVAEEIDESSPEPQVAIGDLHFARKDYRKAIEYFDGALRLSPNHAMAHCRRGISHYYRKNYNEALQDLRKAESLDEDIPNIGTYISMAKKKAKK